MKTKHLLLVLVAFILAACSKEITTPDEQSKLIFGKWSLNHISGGYSGAGEEVTDVREVEFLSNGKSKWYVNSNIDHKAKFTLKKVNNMFGENQLEIDYAGDGKINHTVFELSDHDLVLSENAYDGYTYHYKRMSN
ncbi:MAG TPA: hypothetical protein PKN22_06170 [Taishania sp.]|nr:hypothetical protein [Taishania sp.]HNS42326.1 hypothetical protein [Taishania sp.]